MKIELFTSYCHKLTKAVQVALGADVGANIGHFCIAAGLIGIPTIAIEAMADNYLLLAKSLSANSIRNVMPSYLAPSDSFSHVTLQDRGAWASVSSSGAVVASRTLQYPITDTSRRGAGSGDRGASIVDIALLSEGQPATAVRLAFEVVPRSSVHSTGVLTLDVGCRMHAKPAEAETR